jgi:hypothetical protein
MPGDWKKIVTDYTSGGING